MKFLQFLMDRILKDFEMIFLENTHSTKVFTTPSPNPFI